MTDKNEFVAMFKAEAEELLTRLDKGLVNLEKDPANVLIVKELSMIAHSLKGASRVFGFRNIHDITHKMETIFEKIQQQTLVLNSNIANKLFSGLDRIRLILNDIANADSKTIEVSDVCAALESCLGSNSEVKDLSQTRIGEIPQSDTTINFTHGVSSAKDAPALNAAAELNNSSTSINLDKFETREPNTATFAPAEEYIRVPLSRVNKLLNLVGEMVISKMKTSAKITRLKNLTRLSKEIQLKIFSLSEMIKMEMPEANAQLIKILSECQAGIQRLRTDSVQLVDNISTEAFHLDPVIEELQSNMKEIRMLPLATIFEGFPRMVRDIAAQQDKEINLEISGEETELDKKVIDGIRAPLTHILRNSVDHGIEKPETRVALGKPRVGTVKLSASHESGNVIIRIEDDGQGLDIHQIKQTALKKNLATKEDFDLMTEREILNIIFMNGYSTSPIITDISGRGIGLDIARRDIESLKGQIYLDSELGKGTTITLILPLTIAILQVLLVKSAGKLFALSLASINECINVHKNDIFSLDGKMAIHVREHALPVVKMHEVLGLPALPKTDEGVVPTAEPELPIVIVSSLDKQIGFIVDEIISEEEVFIKSLGTFLGKVKNVSGAAILGTGEVVVILDVQDLLANSRLSHPAVLGRTTTPLEKQKERRILIVDDIISTRELEKSILESQGYLVDVAVDGQDGLEKAGKIRYDLIVSDIQMPRMDGFQFCESLKKNEQYKDTPFVFVTSLEKKEDKRRGIEVGAAAYIVKTAFDQSNLLDTIERLIG